MSEQVTEPTPTPAPTPVPTPPPPSVATWGDWWRFLMGKLGSGASSARSLPAVVLKFLERPLILALLCGFVGGEATKIPLPSFNWPWHWPTPTPPKPPVPPIPPQPPAPIPAKGLHVLIVVDNANISKLPSAQVTALTATSVRQYLNATCAKGANGEPEYRILDKNVDMSAESQLWQDAYKLAAGKTLPFIVVSNGTTGYQGPLPADTDSLLKLLKQFGGG